MRGCAGEGVAHNCPKLSDVAYGSERGTQILVGTNTGQILIVLDFLTF